MLAIGSFEARYPLDRVALGRTKIETGSRIAETMSLPNLQDALDERFQY